MPSNSRGSHRSATAWWDRWPLQLTLLTAALLVVYGRALHGPFVFDDEAFIAGNPLVTAPDGLARIWLAPRLSPHYWPISFSLFWTEWQIWGVHTTGYHVVNVVLHALNSVLLLRVLRDLRVQGAPGIALLFAFHPLNVEAVAWIFQAKTLLAFGLGTCSFLTYRRSYLRHQPRLHLLSIALFGLGLLAKTVIAPLPLVLLAMHLLNRDRPVLPIAQRLAPFFGLALAAGLVGIWFEGHGPHPEEFATHLRAVDRLALAGSSFWFYVGRMLWPWPLLFVYPRPAAPFEGWPSLLPLLALVLVFAIAAWRSASGFGRLLLVSLGFSLLLLLPVMGFLDISYMRYSFVADHWAYPALPGVLWGNVEGARRVAHRILPRHASAVNASLAACMLLIFATLTSRQASLYASSRTLWEDTLRGNPEAWVASYNLGVEEQSRGDLLEAIEHYRRSLAVNPLDARAQYNLAVGLRDIGDSEGAIAHFQQAIEVRPSYPRAWRELGATLHRAGHDSMAVTALDRAIHLEPSDAQAHAQLGAVLLEIGASQEPRAAEEFRTAVTMDSSLAKVWLQPGQFWTGADPRDPDRWRVLARALISAGRRSDARVAIERGRRAAEKQADRTRVIEFDRMGRDLE